jgi:hypothetical protein
MSLSRTELLTEARRLRDLGRYIDSLSKFREVQSLQDGVALRAEVAGMFLEQGYLLRCHGELSSRLSSPQDRDTDPVGSATADMLLCFSTAVTTVHFSDQIQGAVNLYESHLAALTISDYTGQHVRDSLP